MNTAVRILAAAIAVNAAQGFAQVPPPTSVDLSTLKKPQTTSPATVVGAPQQIVNQKIVTSSAQSNLNQKTPAGTPATQTTTTSSRLLGNTLPGSAPQVASNTAPVAATTPPTSTPPAGAVNPTVATKPGVNVLNAIGATTPSSPTTNAPAPSSTSDLQVRIPGRKL